MTNSIGILLTNIGTPDQATPKAVRQFLREFLSDQDVVSLPRIIWWPILHGFILRSRPKKSAAFYQKIWTSDGSPLLIYSQKLAKKLAEELKMPVEIGMRYGNPSIKKALEAFREKNINKIIVFPLYPQYSTTTTESTIHYLAKLDAKNSLQIISHYADNADYINAITVSIQETWKIRGKAQHLLFSFHGIPKYYIKKGDPYAHLCHLTAKRVAKELQLTDSQWSLAFQSRLGRAEWLTPYLNKTLAEFPSRGITQLDVIAPGFSVDCLETLEEIAIRGKEQFLKAGGKSFCYIPALNDQQTHVTLLKNIIIKNIA